MEINTPIVQGFATYTNATMAQVWEDVMNANPTYAWRYEEQTDSYYVHPKTNAVSMMHCDPISVTNALVKTFFNTHS